MTTFIISLLLFFNFYAHTQPYREREPLLMYYAQEFEKEVGVKIPRNLHMEFLSRENRVVGTCLQTPFLNFIKIDPTWYFKGSTPLSRRSVVYHELGHCLCDLDHHNTITKIGCPESLMHESTMGEFCLRRNWSKYIQRLRTECLDK